MTIHQVGSHDCNPRGCASSSPARWATSFMPCLFSRPCGSDGRIHLAWVVNRPFQASLLHGHADLDELIVYDRAGTGIDPWGSWQPPACFRS